MDTRLLSSFVAAASNVLRAEVRPGAICIQNLADSLDDISMLLFCVGAQVRGAVLYAMSEETAADILSHILGDPPEESRLATQKGVAELGVKIGKQARQRLAQAGIEVNISPPALLIGEEPFDSKLDVPGLSVPLDTDWGQIQVHLALQEVLSVEHAGVGANGTYLRGHGVH